MEWSALILKAIAVFALVLLNGFFVAAEFALVKIRDTQLQTLASKGNRRARVARRIVQNLDAALSATQLGITIASLGLGWIGEPLFVHLLSPVMTWLNIESEQVRHSVSFAFGFSVLTFMHIVLGELAPKSLAIQKTLPTSLWVAAPLEWFYKVSFPAIWALNHTANWILRRFGIEPVSEAEKVHSREELRLLVASAQRQTGTMLGRDIVLNALDLSRRLVRDVMRPRKEIVALDTEASVSECLDVAEKSRYSRFPLCEGGDLDKTLGVIHIKDLFAMRLKVKQAIELAPVTRKLIYVPETTRLEKLLQLFLDRKLHFAIVIDEYGGTVGMATLENILEELVGQIQDEFDQEKALLVRLDENTWDIDGALPVHELSELVGQSLDTEGIATTSGWVTQQLGGFPKAGEIITLGAFELRVEETDAVRVARLRLVHYPEREQVAPPPETKP